MKIHYFQHVPFEGLGCLKNWVDQSYNSLTATRFFEDQNLPFVDICDLLIIMGGPMGVHDEHLFPWMKKEKKFIETALNKGKKVLGVCLGAQLLADVLGAKVYKNQEKEIGWFPVQLTETGNTHPFFKGFPESPVVFHWHGDTFDLPNNSTLLASSVVCSNQAFMYKDQAVGLQFHLEMTEAGLNEIVRNCRNELVSASWIQDEKSILLAPYLLSSNKLMLKLIENFIAS